MLKSLNYKVEFPTTGRCFENQIEFAPGLTAITGRNEKGKTLIIEMIGYCLFGSKALRGQASDYKSLAATLAFEARGKSVLIERAKKETLWIDGNIEAVGADAINKAVPALLGFGLDVFNVACAAQQGDLGRLTEMKPTARRTMVDQLIGLDVIETIEKEVKAEAKMHETVAANLAVSMAEPVEPVEPDDYEPSLNLEQTLADVQAHQQKRDQLLLVKEPVEPTAPVAPDHTDVAALEEHEAVRQKALQDKARLEGQLAGMPEATVSRGDLEKALAYQTYAAEVSRRGPKPEYSVKDLKAMEMVWDAKAQVAGREAIDCPACQHHFVPNIDAAILAVAEGNQPELTVAQITGQFRRHELWAEPLAEVAEFTIPNMQKEILAHAHTDDRVGVLNRLADIQVPADRAGDLRAARAYQSDRAIYDERVSRYRSEMDTYEGARRAVEAMEDRSTDLLALRTRASDARSYEGYLDRYRNDAARYTELVQRVADKRDAAEGYSRGADALKATRLRVKQELAPALSVAASSLLASMTGGERRHVAVDHDFNIVVDGQPLQTLSGSGKSVVNLALRIGLGQVLTSKVLPIFMGDEIDKDMDSDRASTTHNTLQSLKQFLTQIIVVTHKDDFVADQQIAL
jgi:DNA repair exonuclease SbcCD ATPase subunit